LSTEKADQLTLLDLRKFNRSTQYLISVAIVTVIAASCYFNASLINYKIVALVLLMSVSILAMVLDILPVLLAAVLSALVWNFFFIPPLFTFHIDNAEDVLMFLLYFFIAMVNTVLSFKIRREERKARDKEEKEKAIKLYNTLLNSLSHELRTPIATIIGAVDALKENKEQLTPANQNELLNQIDIAGMRLNREVENLLNMSRLETGMLQPNFDWCDTNELVNSVIQQLSTCTQTIRFKQDEQLPLFKYDRGLMEQVLLNIIHNAINYTPPDATIQVDVTQQLECCIIRVSDNGKGIPEGEIQFIFDKFYRLPHTKTGGSGLGLSIVKGFTEAHRGTVAVENNPEGGLTFTITIPSETSYLHNLKNE
jgi:two-component system sensor histidine kinase KdpD